MCLPLLIFPCTISPEASLLAPAHPGGPGTRAVKWLWFVVCGVRFYCEYEWVVDSTVCEYVWVVDSTVSVYVWVVVICVVMVQCVAFAVF